MPTNSDLAIICTLLTIIVKALINWRRDRARTEREERHREWERQDRETKNRELLEKIDENTQVSVEAFTVANHVNEKIVTVGEAAQQAAQINTADVMRELAELRSLVEKTHRTLLDVHEDSKT
jgi:uncharacterized membrane protein YhiD involved in acid resistance